MTDVFISYARADRSLAQRLASRLHASGLSVWWDTNLVATSENFNAVIDAELRAAQRCIVIWTRFSVRSLFVNAEAIRAANLGKLVNTSDGTIAGEDLPLPFNAQHIVAVDDLPSVLAAVRPSLQRRRTTEAAAARLPTAPQPECHLLTEGLAAISARALDLLHAIEIEHPADPAFDAEQLLRAAQHLADTLELFDNRVFLPPSADFESQLLFKRVKAALVEQRPRILKECGWLVRHQSPDVIATARHDLALAAQTLMNAASETHPRSNSVALTPNDRGADRTGLSGGSARPKALPA